MSNKVIQYLVTKTDTITHDSVIIGNFYNADVALGFVNDYINENFIKMHYQKLHENKNSIAIYKYGMFWGKSLVCKIQILESNEP